MADNSLDIRRRRAEAEAEALDLELQMQQQKPAEDAPEESYSPSFWDALANYASQQSMVGPMSTEGEGPQAPAYPEIQPEDTEALQQGLRKGAATGTRLAGTAAGYYLGKNPVAGATGEEIALRFNRLTGLEDEGQGVLDDAKNYAERSLFNFGADKLIGRFSPGLRYGRQLVEDAASSYINNPIIQDVIKYAKGAPRGEIMKGKATTPVIGARRLAKAIPSVEQAVNDRAVIGQQFGMPRSSKSAKEIAISDSLKENSKGLFGSKIFESGTPDVDIINGVKPGKNVLEFPVGTPPKSPDEALGFIATAKQNILKKRSEVIDYLDNLWTKVNTAASTPLTQSKAGGKTTSKLSDIGKVVADKKSLQGINYHTDIAPKLDDLEKLIAKRSKLIGSAPEAAEMQKVIEEMYASINAIKTLGPAKAVKAAGGDPSAYTGRTGGDLSFKDTQDLLDNVNHIRRQLQEFDIASQSGKLQLTRSDITGNGAQLKAFAELQSALKQSLKEKASTVLSLAEKKYPGLIPEQYKGMDHDIVDKLNNTYAPLTDLESAIKMHSGATDAMGAAPIPESMIGKGQLREEGMLPTSKPGFVQKINQGVGRLYSHFFEDPNGLKVAKEMATRNKQPYENLEVLSRLQGQKIPTRSDIEMPDVIGMPYVGNSGPSMSDAVKLGALRATSMGMGLDEAQAQEPPQLPRSPELIAEDPQMQQYLITQLSPDAQAVMSDAIKRRDPIALEGALSVAMEERPDLFEPSMSGLQSEMVRNGKVIIGSQAEAEAYKVTVSALYRSGQVDANFLAEQISALNDPHDREIMPRPGQQKVGGPVPSPAPSPVSQLAKQMPEATRQTLAGEQNVPPY